MITFNKTRCAPYNAHKFRLSDRSCQECLSIKRCSQTFFVFISIEYNKKVKIKKNAFKAMPSTR